MANEPRNDELESVALKIFVERVGSRPPAFGIEQIAAQCFREADAFITTRNRVRNKELIPAEKDTKPKLSEASAPNLSPLHPINLVSQRFGNLDRVKQINDWLKTHDKKENQTDQDFVEEFNRQFRDLNWREKTPPESLNVINTARVIFPAYCG